MYILKKEQIYLIRKGVRKLKKILILGIFTILLVTGCGKYTIDKALKDFTNKVQSSKSYKIEGTMEISSGEETFVYSIESYFLKDDYYKVVLVNQTNNHEQIILKNDEGIYVVTPTLNKSFKFDSVWPDNSSQAYLLGSLLKDLKNDPKVTMEETDKNYILKSTVDYPNNEELTYQKIYFDKDMNIAKVEVYNADDIVKIKVNFNKVNLKAKLDEEDFALDDLIEEDLNPEPNKTETDNQEEVKDNTSCTGADCQNETSQCGKDGCTEDNSSSSATLDDIIYPLYIPANTYLSDSETVNGEDSNRVILTFSGERNFVIVEEVSKVNDEFEIIPVYGDPLMLNETIGALSSNSLSWDANNINYYLVSSDLSTSEMVSVAASLGNSTLVSSLK